MAKRDQKYSADFYEKEKKVIEVVKESKPDSNLILMVIGLINQSADQNREDIARKIIDTVRNY